MEYTHNLSIKVWSPGCKDITNYSNVNRKIKDLLLDNSFTEVVNFNGIEHNVTIKWETPFWDEKIKHLIVGDFIANISYSHTYDTIIFKHTEMVLHKIEETLRTSLDIEFYQIESNTSSKKSAFTKLSDHTNRFQNHNNMKFQSNQKLCQMTSC